MGLKDKLANDNSNLSAFNGATPNKRPGARATSKLHRTYSIDGNPSFNNKPSPSSLDLGGVTPSKYSDNLPS